MKLILGYFYFFFWWEMECFFVSYNVSDFSFLLFLSPKISTPAIHSIKREREKEEKERGKGDDGGIFFRC